MNFYTQMIGGIGDLLIAMQKPGSHLGYFPALQARGDSTMIEAHANTDAAVALFERQPFVNHLRFRGKGLRIDSAPGARFDMLRQWSGLEWTRPRIVLDDYEQAYLDTVRSRGSYVAVHVAASLPEKVPPHFPALLDRLKYAGVRTILLGIEATDDGPAIVGNRSLGYRIITSGHIVPPPRLRLHIALAQQARKFIGALSCFNCAAQLAGVPSFVLVNRSIQDPQIYRMMRENSAIIEPWNLGTKKAEDIYREAGWWASR